MWITLNFNSKSKKWNGDICRGALDIEIGWDWSFGLGATLGDIHTDFFFCFREFSGKTNSVIVGFGMHSKPTKFDEIRWSHFWKNRNLIFFSSELLLILRVDRKQKYGLEIFARWDYYIEFERDWSVGSGPTLGD